MHYCNRPLLENFSVFRSQDSEETQAWLQKVDFHVDFPNGRPHQLDVRLNGLYLPGMYFGYAQYASVVSVKASPARNDYWVQLPIRGHLEAKVGATRIDCNSSRSWIASPTRDDYYFMRSGADSARIHMCLNRAAISQHLAALLDEPVGEAPEFEPVMDLATGYGNSLARHALMIASDLDQTGSRFFNLVAMTMFQEYVFTMLLLSHPHNYRDALRRRERPIASRDVKRAIEFMQDHLDMPITLADIVKASGVPGRTLIKHFHDYRGLSPMRYLRDARMRKVREALQSAEFGASVTEIATHWGFSHMGRFAIEYRRMFGERPSETLTRRAKYPLVKTRRYPAGSFSDFRAAWWMTRK